MRLPTNVENIIESIEDLPTRTRNRKVGDIMKATGRENVELGDKIAWLAMREDRIYEYEEVIELLEKLRNTRSTLQQYIDAMKEAV